MDAVIKMGLLNKIALMLKEVKAPAFKIESDEQDLETGLIFFWVSVKGKCTPPILKDPVILLRESRSKNCFSESDHDSIIDAALENQKRIIEDKYKKTFLLINHQFSGQLDEPLLVYKDQHNNIHMKTAREIYSSAEMIKKFSSKDSACIGNIVGGYEADQEHKNRAKINNSNNVIMFDSVLLSGK